MGYWCTLHLFDDKKFYREIIPELKGQTGDLSGVCLEFLKSHITGGISHLSREEVNKLIKHNTDRIISISNSLDQDFKTHCEFQKIKNYDNQMVFLNNLDSYYDFCKFFEYYVFRTCADFFPHLPLGKGGVFRNFNLNVKTLSYSIIVALDQWNQFLCGDGMGITNWIKNEDIELLYLDKENLHSDDNQLAQGFLTLLDVAHKNKLSFIVGVDMREETLEVLTNNKLVSSNIWQDKNLNGLLFKR